MVVKNHVRRVFGVIPTWEIFQLPVRVRHDGQQAPGFEQTAHFLKIYIRLVKMFYTLGGENGIEAGLWKFRIKNRVVICAGYPFFL